MKRYLLFAALGCLVFARPLTAVISPNIVLIVTDDEDVVGFQDALDHGLLPDIKTRMVDLGWTAENAFTPESECCPARAMLLKGQYPQNTHVISNHAPNGIQQFVEATSLPVWLQSAGYKTMLAGKYMNEYGIFGPAEPASNPRSAKHVPLGWTIWQGLDDNSTYTSYAHTWTVSAFGAAPAIQTDTAYQTDIVSLRFYRGVQWLIQQGGPWYAEMTPVTPHFHLVSAASRPTPSVQLSRQLGSVRSGWHVACPICEYVEPTAADESGLQRGEGGQTGADSLCAADDASGYRLRAGHLQPPD